MAAHANQAANDLGDVLDELIRVQALADDLAPLDVSILARLAGEVGEAQEALKSLRSKLDLAIEAKLPGPTTQVMPSGWRLKANYHAPKERFDNGLLLSQVGSSLADHLSVAQVVDSDGQAVEGREVVTRIVERVGQLVGVSEKFAAWRKGALRDLGIEPTRFVHTETRPGMKIELDRVETD